MGTVIVLAILALAAFAAVRHIYRRKKAGKSCCGGSCDGCCSCSKEKKRDEN
ncbi:MAG: FeoB-associated Cys-rich membrane protein [Candidatus Onthomonas sp.]